MLAICTCLYIQKQLTTTPLDILLEGYTQQTNATNATFPAPYQNIHDEGEMAVYAAINAYVQNNKKKTEWYESRIKEKDERLKEKEDVIKMKDDIIESKNAEIDRQAEKIKALEKQIASLIAQNTAESQSTRNTTKSRRKKITKEDFMALILWKDKEEALSILKNLIDGNAGQHVAAVLTKAKSVGMLSRLPARGEFLAAGFDVEEKQWRGISAYFEPKNEVRTKELANTIELQPSTH